MEYSKGDTFIATCHSNRTFDRIGVVTGEGEEYSKIHSGFNIIFISLTGNLMVVEISHQTAGKDCAIVYYPVLIGDHKGWMVSGEMERIREEASVQ